MKRLGDLYLWELFCMFLISYRNRLNIWDTFHANHLLFVFVWDKIHFPDYSWSHFRALRRWKWMGYTGARSFNFCAFWLLILQFRLLFFFWRFLDKFRRLLQRLILQINFLRETAFLFYLDRVIEATLTFLLLTLDILLKILNHTFSHWNIGSIMLVL